MNTPYQMNYKAPIADNWTHHSPAAPETADEVSSMLERLKAESTSLESYLTDLESELRRVHLKRKVVGKKLSVLSELARDVEALRSEPIAAAPMVAMPAAHPEVRTPVAAESRPSRTKKILCAASVVVVALAVTFIALEQTGQIHSCVSCAPAKLLGLM